MFRPQRPDYIFISVIAVLLLFGLAVLASATSPEGYLRFNDQYFFVKKQLLLGLLPGSIIFLILSNFNYRQLKSAARPLFYFSLLLLLLVLVPGIGTELGGARSWFHFLGFSFQPTELAKLTLIIFLASRLAELKGDDFKDWQKSLVPFLIVLTLLAVLILKQPDFGTLMILILIALIMYFAAGGSILHLTGLGAAAVALAAVMILLAPYRLARLTTFLDPASQPLGSSYQINQAILAIGSGGFWGLGWGHSRQKFQYLPEVSADSIFAILGEELGWVLGAVFLLLWLWLLWRSLKIAESCPDKFGRLLVAGIAVWLFGQTVVNVSSITGLLPVTGLPLPLVSHGGSGLIVSLAALGIVVNVSKRSL